MAILVQGDVYTDVISSDPRVFAITRDVCRARPTGYQYMKRYKTGHWDGYISLMAGMQTFPSGLCGIVEEALRNAGYEVEYRGDDVFPLQCDWERYIVPEMLQGITLREYQMNAIAALLGNVRGVAKMATNSGKTEVMAGIIQAFDNVAFHMQEKYGVDDPWDVLVITHRKEIMYQTVERFSKRLGRDDIGMIGDGVNRPGKITVAMIQSLSRCGATELGQLFHNVRILMVDECHHVSSNQMMNVLFYIGGAYRFGFSGTPLKADVLADMKLMAATGPVLTDISNKYMICRGYSTRPTIIMQIIASPDRWDGDYHSVYKECIVHNDERNRVICEFAVESKGVVLVLVNHLEHGRILRDILPNAVFVTGPDQTDDRLEILRRMRERQPGVYIATPIFDEGVDVPGIDVLILAGGGKSNIKLLQRLGRGMRTDPDKVQLLVLDFIDDTNRYLFKHSEERLNVYEREDFQILLRD